MLSKFQSNFLIGIEIRLFAINLEGLLSQIFLSLAQASIAAFLSVCEIWMETPGRNLSTTFGHSLKKITEDCFCPPTYSPEG